jgi:endonuclease YncB( thermonuclease family)
MKYASSILTAIVFAIFVWFLAHEEPPSRETFGGTVNWVTDGDTFKIQGYPWPIRIWGIDAPERDTNAGVTARVFVERLIKGQNLTCEKVVVDRYQRTVAKCFLGDQDIARLILGASHAREYCSFSNGFYGRC